MVCVDFSQSWLDTGTQKHFNLQTLLSLSNEVCLFTINREVENTALSSYKLHTPIFNRWLMYSTL